MHSARARPDPMRQEAPAVDAAPDNTPAAVSTSTTAVAATTEPSTAALSVTPKSCAETVVAKTPEPVVNSQIGEEHLVRPETEEKANEDEVFHATVTEVTRGRNRILYFHFENGQVWQQIEPRYLPRIKNLPVQVSISKGVFGSHDLRTESFGKSVKVKRLN